MQALARCPSPVESGDENLSSAFSGFLLAKLHFADLVDSTHIDLCGWTDRLKFAIDHFAQRDIVS